LLIRHRHFRWWLGFFLVAATLAVGSRVALDVLTPGPVTGGSSAGLWYGLIGSALMVFAGLLSLHRRLPALRWLGQRQAWLRGHIWLGLLSGVFIACHAGPNLGGPLECVLWVVVLAVLGSGVAGWIVQAWLPGDLTDRFPEGVEAPFEQIPHLCDLLRRQAVSTLEKARQGPALGPSARDELKELLDRVHDYLRPDSDPASPLARAEQAELAFGRLLSLPGLAPAREALLEVQRLCGERRQLARQARLHRLLHAWLLVHVPLSVVLLVLGLVHAFTAVYW
jgi:hypothetical protein